MAIFLLRGIYGSNYDPPAATGILFNDVQSNSFGAAFIEELASEGITGGCGGGNYCPNQAVTRTQMAIFLIRATHGVAFVPPAATGIFADVPADFLAQTISNSWLPMASPADAATASSAPMLWSDVTRWLYSW